MLCLKKIFELVKVNGNIQYQQQLQNVLQNHQCINLQNIYIRFSFSLNLNRVIYLIKGSKIVLVII